MMKGETTMKNTTEVTTTATTTTNNNMKGDNTMKETIATATMNTTTTATMKGDTTMKNTTEGKDIATMNQISIFENVSFDGAISFVPCMRSNERVLVYDIRCSLIDGDYKTLLSLVKSWLVMVSKPENPATIDGDVLDIARGLIKLAYVGKKASCKEHKDGARATIDVLNTSRLKAWLYTMKEKRFDMVAIAGERPEEKACNRIASTKKSPSVTLAGQVLTMSDVQRMIDAGELVVSVK